MNAFRPFELHAIRLMGADILSAEMLAALETVDTIEHYEYTGSGYYLTVKHACFAPERVTLSRPFVIGIAGDVTAGFIAYIGDGTLTLECHTWGAVDVPADFRELPVAIELLRSTVSAASNIQPAKELTNKVTRIARALSLPDTGQDWGVEHSDPGRLPEFVDFAEALKPENDWEMEALAELILQSTEDSIEAGSLTRDLRDTVVRFLASHAAVFPITLAQWSGYRESQGWHVVGLLREAGLVRGTDTD